MNATAERLLDRAEEAIRVRGYGALSFRTLAQEVGIKSASVHYHYPTKAHLGVAVASRYRERFAAALDAIDASGASPSRRLDAYIDIYRSEMRAGSNRMSICMMLAAEMESLPGEIRECVTAFYRMNLDWLGELLGRAGNPHPAVAARQVLSLLQGALMGAKTLTSPDYFEAATDAIHRLVGD